MYQGLHAKFTQNGDLGDLLKSTAGYLLCEKSPRDRYWGGLVKGAQNRLGVLLMWLRDSGDLEKDEIKREDVQCLKSA